jgi:hypothetical protein
MGGRSDAQTQERAARADFFAGRLSGAGCFRAKSKTKAGDSQMEVIKQRVDFSQESTIEISGTRYVVSAHFDESREPPKPKLARLLQKEVQNQLLHL